MAATLLPHSSGKPLWIKPNAGLPELVDGRTVFRESPEAMASRVRDLLAAGANVVGGCCGTTPEHIRRMAAAVDEACHPPSPSGRGRPSQGDGPGEGA